MSQMSRMYAARRVAFLSRALDAGEYRSPRMRRNAVDRYAHWATEEMFRRLGYVAACLKATNLFNTLPE